MRRHQTNLTESLGFFEKGCEAYAPVSTRDICETFIMQKVWKSSENTGAYIDSRYLYKNATSERISPNYFGKSNFWDGRTCA